MLQLLRIIAVIFGLFTATSAFSDDSSKPVHVRKYTRKDGTVVQAHSRSLPHSSKSSRSKTLNAPSPTSSNSTVPRDSRGRIARSKGAKESFEKSHPCPATGKTTGGCPGYVVDHMKPLACGGVDAPENMQWQTTAESKAKDKVERQGCSAP